MKNSMATGDELEMFCRGANFDWSLVQIQTSTSFVSSCAIARNMFVPFFIILECLTVRVSIYWNALNLDVLKFHLYKILCPWAKEKEQVEAYLQNTLEYYYNRKR